MTKCRWHCSDGHRSSHVPANLRSAQHVHTDGAYELNCSGALPCADHLLSAMFVCSPRARAWCVSRERKKGAKVEDLYETISTIGKGSGEGSSSIFRPGCSTNCGVFQATKIGPRARGDAIVVVPTCFPAALYIVTIAHSSVLMPHLQQQMLLYRGCFGPASRKYFFFLPSFFFLLGCPKRRLWMVIRVECTFTSQLSLTLFDMWLMSLYMRGACFHFSCGGVGSLGGALAAFRTRTFSPLRPLFSARHVARHAVARAPQEKAQMKLGLLLCISSAYVCSFYSRHRFGTMMCVLQWG